MQKHTSPKSISRKQLKKVIASADGEPFFWDLKPVKRFIFGKKYKAREDDAEAYLSEELMDELRQQIKSLQGLQKRCLKQRGRDREFALFNAILSFRCKLQEWERIELCCRFVKCLSHPVFASRYDEFYILIDVASTADIKTKSRWAQAMRFCYRERKQWQDCITLKAFVKKNGGIAGCARQMACPRPIRKIGAQKLGLRRDWV